MLLGKQSMMLPQGKPLQVALVLCATKLLDSTLAKLKMFCTLRCVWKLIQASARFHPQTTFAW